MNMKLYCADVRGADEKKAAAPGRSPRAGSAFAASLLAYAAREFWGAETLPRIGTRKTGAPFFVDFPDWHFSLSHSRSHVLAAVSDYPVGADIETRRERPPAFIGKLTTRREREDFDFFELWVLRESLYKLTGEGDLRKMRFSRLNGAIMAPVEGVRCRLYGDIPGCAAAVSCFRGEFPEAVIMVKTCEICS
jgi:phosphopantetheinyl transferase